MEDNIIKQTLYNEKKTVLVGSTAATQHWA